MPEIRKEPQNIEAEMAVLSCAFLSVGAADKVIEELTEDMFYSEPNKKIYNAIRSLKDKNTPIDITTMSNELDNIKQLSNVGGIEYLTEVMEYVPTTANIDYYIKIIYEKYILRTMISKSNEIIASCYEEADDVEDVVEKAEKSILSVSKDSFGNAIQPIQQVLTNAQTELERLAKVGSDVTGISTGYRALDLKTTGLHPKELIILAARPAMGKSAFALNIATNMAIQGKKSVAIFSLEMGAEQIAQRMFSAVGQVEANHIRTGKLDNNDWKRVTEAMSQLANTNIYIDDTAGITTREIRSKCRRLANSEKGLDCIIIDYLQLVDSSSKYAGNRVLEVGEVSRELKKLAMELEVPIIALAQLSRQLEQRENKRPLLSDLKESGSIEQDADIVMFLYNDDYYKRPKDVPPSSVMEVIISKSRSGSTGTVELVFDRGYLSFKNYIKGDDED